MVVIGTWYASFLLTLQNLQIALSIALLVPLMTKVISELFKHLIIK